MTRMTGPDCAVMCNLIYTHTHRVRRVEEVRLRRLHCVRFLLFRPRLIRQTYTEMRRLTPEYMGSDTHTQQRTQLTIDSYKNIIEREFVATAILSSIHHTCICEFNQPLNSKIVCSPGGQVSVDGRSYKLLCVCVVVAFMLDV